MSGLHRPVVRHDATGRAGLGLTHLAACLFHSHIRTTRRARHTCHYHHDAFIFHQLSLELY